MSENILDEDVAKLASILEGERAVPLDDDKESEPSEDEGEDAAPEEEASGEEAEEREPDKAIAAPASWDAEAKAEFAKLPPEAQKIIARRESERDKAIQQRLSEVAEQRKAAEADRQAMQQQRQHVGQMLSQHEAAVRSQLMGEFADLKTPADFTKLAQEDPQRYLRYMAHTEQLRAIEAQQRQIWEQQQKEQEAEYGKFQDEQMRLLAEKAPGFLDGEKASANRDKARTYLKGLGFSDKEINGLVDHRHALILRDALKAKELEAQMKSAKDKKIAPVQKVTKPGPGQGDEKLSVNKAALRKIARHGNTEEQVAVFAKHFKDMLS